MVRNWADGHDGHGNKVHPDVQAAAVKAMAEWEAAKAAAHAQSGGKRSRGAAELRGTGDARPRRRPAAPWR